MRQLLRMIVIEGTGASEATVPGRGKTGRGKDRGGGYSGKGQVYTFAAAFRWTTHVVIAMLDAPKATADTFGFTTAAWTAAPVVSRVISRTGALLGVTPDDRRDVELSELMRLVGKQGH